MVSSRLITEHVDISEDQLDLSRIPDDGIARMHKLLKKELRAQYSTDILRFLEERKISIRDVVTEVRSKFTASRIARDVEEGSIREIDLNAAFPCLAARNIEVIECRWTHSETIVDVAMRNAMTKYAEHFHQTSVPLMQPMDREVVRVALPELEIVRLAFDCESQDTMAATGAANLINGQIYDELGINSCFSFDQLHRICKAWMVPWIVFLATAYKHKISWRYRV